MKALICWSVLSALFVFETAVAQMGNAEKAKEVFKEKFEVVRNAQGEISFVRSKKAVTTLALGPLLEMILREVKRAPVHAQLWSDQALSTKNYLNETVDGSIYAKNSLQGSSFTAPMLYGVNTSGVQEVEELYQGIISLTKNSAAPLLEKVKSSKDWQDFQKKITELFITVRPDVVANPEDPRYFFKREAITTISQTILKQAAQRMESVPFIGTLAFVFNQLGQFIGDQREFHQNYLLYLFENFPSSTFDMTDLEVAHTISSIYESKLGLMQYKKLEEVKRLWDQYGWNNFSATKRNAGSWLQTFENTRLYEPGVSQRLSFAFAKVTLAQGKNAGNKFIINLLNTAHQFSSRPAVAYDLAHPKKVKSIRLLVRLGQLGLTFVPLNSNIKQLINNFATSTYRPHVMVEGALVAYLEVNGEQDLAAYISSQALNPYTSIE
jgi:hypothetical protein